MIFRAWWRASACVVGALSFGACQSFDVEENQFAVIAVPIVPVEGGGYTTRPSAFFFEGVGIRLATTQVGAQGCIAQDIGEPLPDTFQDIDAGEEVNVSVGTGATMDEGFLAPSAVGARILYQLPSGESLAIQPGDRVTVTIPGATGGFPARVVSVNTIADFTPDPVTLPTTATDLQVTWDPRSPNPGTAMFYSFRYATEGETLNREIACVFADDGSGIVEAELLADFKQAETRVIQAQRALITLERIGNAITHFTSSLIKPVAIVAGP